MLPHRRAMRSCLSMSSKKWRGLQLNRLFIRSNNPFIASGHVIYILEAASSHLTPEVWNKAHIQGFESWCRKSSENISEHKRYSNEEDICIENYQPQSNRYSERQMEASPAYSFDTVGPFKKRLTTNVILHQRNRCSANSSVVSAQHCKPLLHPLGSILSAQVSFSQ